MVQVKLADRNTETFADPKSPHYKSHTKNVIGWQQRERWEIGSEGEQGARDLWKSSGADLFVLGTPSQELFNSLPCFFCLEISKRNIELTEWVHLPPRQCCVRRGGKKHPIISSDWFPCRLLVPQILKRHCFHLLVKSIRWPGSPKSRSRGVKDPICSRKRIKKKRGLNY